MTIMIKVAMWTALGTIISIFNKNLKTKAKQRKEIDAMEKKIKCNRKAVIRNYLATEIR